MIRDEKPGLTDRHGDAGLRWLLDRRNSWGLTDSELASLLGVSTETLLSWQSQVSTGEMVRLPSDTFERIGLLLGVHQGLVNLTPSGHESLAAEWFQKPIQLWGLAGHSIRSHLLNDSRRAVLIEMVRRIKSETA